MAIEQKEVILHVKKVLIYSIRTIYRSAHDHPFIFGVLCFMLLLYRIFPSLFVFLVSSSPVLICTALLLGTLLSYGEPNIPEIEEVDQKTQEISSLKVGSASADLVIRRNESCTVETHVENRREVEERGVEEAVLGEREASTHCKVEADIPSATAYDERDEKDDGLAASSSTKEDEKEIHGEQIVTKERELSEQEITEKKEFSVQKLAESVLKVGQDVDGFNATDQKDIEGLKVEIHKPALENYFDSSLGSPWQHIDNHGDHDSSLDSESDRAESSSPDASMADIIPMLDELHPLLDSETPQPPLLSKGSMGGASQRSSHDLESDDGSMEEEAENLEDEEEEEEEEEEEPQEEKDDEAEAAVTWTADDQKNVMDLGSSELERNQRLESLIAKRRARKDLHFETERNLIDLDGSTEELSHFHIKIPPISAPRWNPFDLPYGSEESMGLPPIPGSAPSVLLPRRNPFDFPHDPVGESSSRTVETWRHQDFASDPQHDMFFRRSETFNLLGSERKHDKHESMLKAYFVEEGMDSLETSSVQRQFSDKSDSKVSSVPESDALSSVTDQEYHKELVEQELHQEGELLSASEHDAYPAVRESQSSEEVESMDIEQEKSVINVANDRGIQIDANVVVDETHQAAEAFGAMEEEVRDEVDLHPTISDAEKLEVIEAKYEESSHSSEEDGKSPRSSFHEQVANLEQTSDAMPTLGDPDHLSRGERVDDSYVADPIYDLSPSAIKKSLSNISEASSDSGKGGPDASSLKFEMQDVVLSPRPVETNANSGVGSTGELAPSTGGLWVNSSSLASEYDLRSRNVTELRETDCVEVQKNATDPIAPVLSEPRATDIMNHSNLSSAKAESREGSGIDVDVNHQTEGNKMIDAATSSYLDGLLLSDYLSSSASEKAQSTEESGIQPSPEVGVGESQMGVLDLPPIPEENLDDCKPDEEHENSAKPEPVVVITGLQILEEPDFILSDIEQEISLLQKKSTEESCVDGNYGLANESEDVDSRVVIPTISMHDGSFTGLQLLEPKESMDFSTLSEVKPELEIESSTVMTNSRGDIINAFQSNQEGWSQQNVNDMEEESDKVHPDVMNIRGIDEGLLAELDAVGDFHVVELRSEQQGSELGRSDDIATSYLTAEILEITSQLHVSEVRSTEYADKSLSLPSEACSSLSEELHSVIEEPKTMESEVGSSFEASFVNPEQTVYNPKLHVLEASSIEEIDSVFKQLQEEAGASSASELVVGKSETATSEVNASELVITERDPDLTIADSELLVLEAKSVEDISSAFKRLGEESLGKSVVPEVGPSQILPGGTHFEPTEIHSDLQVVEAKSLEDIHLAFEQASDGISENHPKVPKPSDGSPEVEASDKHLEPNVLEVHSAEEIELAFKEAVSKETVSSVQQDDGKSEGVEKMDEDYISNASTSTKEKKKDKSGKSGSSSSSSSSSSDSD